MFNRTVSELSLRMARCFFVPSKVICNSTFQLVLLSPLCFISFQAFPQSIHTSASLQRDLLDTPVSSGKVYQTQLTIKRLSITSLHADVVPPSEMAPISRPPLPLVTSRSLSFPEKFLAPRQAWVSNLDTVDEEKLGLVDLHPSVFAYKPRVDLIHSNIRWQRMYRFVVKTLFPHNFLTFALERSRHPPLFKFN